MAAVNQAYAHVYTEEVDQMTFQLARLRQTMRIIKEESEEEKRGRKAMKGQIDMKSEADDHQMEISQVEFFQELNEKVLSNTRKMERLSSRHTLDEKNVNIPIVEQENLRVSMPASLI